MPIKVVGTIFCPLDRGEPMTHIFCSAAIHITGFGKFRDIWRDWNFKFKRIGPLICSQIECAGPDADQNRPSFHQKIRIEIEFRVNGVSVQNVINHLITHDEFIPILDGSGNTTRSEDSEEQIFVSFQSHLKSARRSNSFRQLNI